MSVDLRTTLPGPRPAEPAGGSACPLAGKARDARRLEEAGAAAVVSCPRCSRSRSCTTRCSSPEPYEDRRESFAEALTYFPEVADYNTGPDAYLRHLEATRRVSIPVIGSLNGTSAAAGSAYARLIQEAGADALELNVYFVATDPRRDRPRRSRHRYLDLVAGRPGPITIPLAVKIGPYFSSVGRTWPAARRGRGRRAGAVQPLPPARHRPRHPDGRPEPGFEHRDELRLPLRWIAILAGASTARSRRRPGSTPRGRAQAAPGRAPT